MHQKTTPYGNWTSPITAAQVAASAKYLQNIQSDSEYIYWLESRPEEQGRQVVMRMSLLSNTVYTHTPPSYHVRSRVHEYGGGDYCVHHGTVYFCNDQDQRLYQQKEQTILPLTTAPKMSKAWRYADPICTPDSAHIIVIRESHHTHQTLHELVAISTDPDQPGIKILATGYDFYSSPAISSDGQQLAWICWNHPHMPWDSTELWLAELSPNMELIHPRCIAGGPTESVMQPQWSPDDRLFFISDQNNWWNIYLYSPLYAHDKKTAYSPVCSMPAECAVPPWVFGIRTYAFLDAERVIVLSIRQGQSEIGMIDHHQYQPFSLPFTHLIPTLSLYQNKIFMIGATSTVLPVLAEYELNSDTLQIHYKSASMSMDPDYISTAEALCFPTIDDESAYGFYYPPCNRDYVAPDTEKPPLILCCHGGPTAATHPSLNLKIQFWTSRGFAVMDVNYAGSTGFGKAYRHRLYQQWGKIDVADCVQATTYLIEKNRVDPHRLFIRGSSSGGYTVLCALVFYDIFRAGCGYAGIADLVSLQDIQDNGFESHYFHTLIGPYPEEKSAYIARSPLYHADQLSSPVLFVQGLEDNIVPPQQAETMIAAMKKHDVPYTYITFSEEGHSLKKANNIQRALEKELNFYQNMLI